MKSGGKSSGSFQVEGCMAESESGSQSQSQSAFGAGSPLHIAAWKGGCRLQVGMQAGSQAPFELETGNWNFETANAVTGDRRGPVPGVIVEYAGF